MPKQELWLNTYKYVYYMMRSEIVEEMSGSEKTTGVGLNAPHPQMRNLPVSTSFAFRICRNELFR